MSRRELALVVETVKNRAFIFLCSYETAWNQWVTEEEKRGYSFENVKRKIV